MNIFKIILGIIIAALGLGALAASLAIFTSGQWAPVVNILFGVTVAFLGFSFVWSGTMLVTGSTVRDALGGAVNALQGHGGVGLHKNSYYPHSISRLKEILFNILLYTVLGIAVILISIFSVGKVINLPISL